MASLPECLGGVVGSAIIPLAVASIKTSVTFTELTMVSIFELAVLFVKLTLLRIELAVLFVELAVLFIELAELLEFPALLLVDGDLTYLLVTWLFSSIPCQHYIYIRWCDRIENPRIEIFSSLIG